jgi:hypothetical protein
MYIGMNFVNKTHIGAVATLILVIILSQSRFFGFLMNTALGRTLLICLIIGISYTHKILGVISVLFIIIIFNQSNLWMPEGFTQLDTTTVNNDKKNDKKNAKNNTKKKENGSSTSMNSTKETSLGGREGSNITEREGTMLRGKRSNEIPVLANSRNQSDDVDPANETVLKEGFFSPF